MPFGFGGISFFGFTAVGQSGSGGAPVVRNQRVHLIRSLNPCCWLCLQGVLAGSAIVFFSYIGFDSVSTQAEEARKYASLSAAGSASTSA